jgi:iron complex outermembrane receptor protein
MAWTESAWDAFVNVGRYVRVPTLGELYGTSVLVHGNPALEPESGMTLDVGARWAERARGEARPAWASLTTFVRWATDLVSYVRSPQGYVEPFNVAGARFTGVEAQAGTGFLRWFAVDVSGTLQDPRDTTAGRRLVNDVLPFQSRLVVVPRLSAESQHVAIGPVARLRGEVRWVYQSSRYADAAGLGVIPEQNSLDAELLAQTANRVWTARLRATDLLDSPRFDIVGFPLPGRSIFLSMEAKW